MSEERKAIQRAREFAFYFITACAFINPITDKIQGGIRIQEAPIEIVAYSPNLAIESVRGSIRPFVQYARELTKREKELYEEQKDKSWGEIYLDKLGYGQEGYTNLNELMNK